MKPELSLAAGLLVGLLAVLFAHDAATRSQNRRLLWSQLVVFTGGAVLIVFPEIARRLASLVGIGRGVDFVLYPTVIWLIRETMVSRRRKQEEEARLTELARAVALDRAGPPKR